MEQLIRFAAELHLVHQSSDNKIAVIGLLYKFGKPNRFLNRVCGTIFKLHFLILLNYFVGKFH